MVYNFTDLHHGMKKKVSGTSFNAGYTYFIYYLAIIIIF